MTLNLFFCILISKSNWKDFEANNWCLMKKNFFLLKYSSQYIKKNSLCCFHRIAIRKEKMASDALKNLALSDTGFVFDPTTGNTYTLNETGLVIVRLLKQDKTKDEIIKSILAEYEVEQDEVERDYSDMIIQLTELGFIR